MAGRWRARRRDERSVRIMLALFRAVWPAVAVGVLVALAGGGRFAIRIVWLAYAAFVLFQLRGDLPARWHRRR